MKLQLLTFCFLTSLLSLSCGTDETNLTDDTSEMTDDGQENNLLEISITRGNSDFYYSRIVGEPIIRAIITGSQGEVLANEEILKNTPNEISVEYDTTAGYMVHFSYRIEYVDRFGIPSVRYKISTFINPDIADYVINGESQRYPLGLYSEEPNTTLTINRGDLILTAIGSSLYSGDSGGTSTNANNFVSFKLDESFSTGILMRTKIASEENMRYHLFNDVTAGTDQSVDFEQMTSSISKSINSPSSNRYRIAGRNFDKVNFPFPILGSTNLDDNNATDYDIPVGIFDEFIMNSESNIEVSNGTEQRLNRTIYSSIESIPNEEILSPILRATSISSDIDNYSIQTEGMFDFYRTFFSFLEPVSSDPYRDYISWEVIGAASNEVSFEMPDILSLVIDTSDNFNVTLVDLDGGDPTLYNSDEINSTQDFINLYTNGQTSPGLRAFEYNSFQLILND